ncbi:MAG: hypothetical protein RLZZ245_1952, partial [Verrucomicrobiota bacterium]
MILYAMAVSVVGVSPLRMALTGGDKAGGEHVFDQCLRRPRAVRFSSLHLGRSGGGAAVGRQIVPRVETVPAELGHQVGRIGGGERRAVDGVVFGVHGVHCHWWKSGGQFFGAGGVEFGQSLGLDGLEEPLRAAHSEAGIDWPVADGGGGFGGVEHAGHQSHPVGDFLWIGGS